MIKNQKLKLNYHYQSGYIALFSTIILVAVFSLLFVGMFVLTMGGIERISDKESSQKANSLAMICMEEALSEIRINPEYNIESISFGSDGNCEIKNKIKSGNNISFESVGYFNNYVKIIKLGVYIREEGGERTLSIINWEEELETVNDSGEVLSTEKIYREESSCLNWNDNFIAESLECDVDDLSLATLENKISFFVRNSNHVTNTGNYIAWNTISHNTGNHYNSLNGKFIAPVNGIYHFSWGGIQRYSWVISRTYLYVNGLNYASNATQLRLDGNSYDAGSRQITLPLNAGDEVAIYLGEGNIYSNYGHFTGHLVTEEITTPSFFVRNSNNVTSTGNYIAWDTISHNTGNHYNSLNGNFTAPVDGMYHFSWGGIPSAAGNISQTYFYINGSNYSSSATQLRLDGGLDKYDAGSRQITLPLNVGDKVAIYLGADGILSNYGHFTGHLILKDYGYRVSKPLFLDEVKKMVETNIYWSSTELLKSEVNIYTAITDNGTSTPGIWEEVIGSTIPGIQPGDNLTGKYLWVKQEIIGKKGLSKLHRLLYEIYYE